MATQIVNRVPLPLRAWLKVPKKRNPLGVANFIKGYVNEYERNPREETRKKIIDLADWLLSQDSGSLGAYSGKGTAYGYHFPWASPGFFAPRNSPNCYVTSLCGEGLLAAFRVTQDQKYLEKAKGIFTFIQNLPVLEEKEGKKCIAYVPAGTPWKVININSVAAGFLCKLYSVTKDETCLEFAAELVRWVASAREENFSWNYTSPKSQSGIGPDNYHTGGVLDGLWDFLQMREDAEIRECFNKGLEYYEKNFFTETGAPRWRATRDYPQDIHGAAQGILTFSKANKLDVARKILRWATEEMQDSQGFFYYQKRKFYTWKVDFMRWNNSWMFLAMTEHLKHAA